MGLRSFTPLVTACPGCGRTTSTVFQELANSIQSHLRERMPHWREQHTGVEGHERRGDGGASLMARARVNMPTSGISLPGNGEAPAAPVFVDGKKTVTLRGANIATEFTQLVDQYVADTYAKH